MAFPLLSGKEYSFFIHGTHRQTFLQVVFISGYLLVDYFQNLNCKQNHTERAHSFFVNIYKNGIPCDKVNLLRMIILVIS
jgi:hypothetical protein